MSLYPYEPAQAKTNLSNTLGKQEMEEAAAKIIFEAQERGTWCFPIYMQDDLEVLRGMELLAGYGWLLFDNNREQECWLVSPEFVKRVCQSPEDRELEKSILGGEF